MNQSIKHLLSVFAYCALLLVTLSAWKGVGVVSILVEPITLTISLITLVSGFRIAIVASILAGMFYDSVSPWAGYPHATAWLLMVIGMSFFIRRWLTERSGASFMLLLPASIWLYYGSLAAYIGSTRLFSSSALQPEWGSWLFVGLIQTFTHTIIGFIIYRIRRSTYTQARTQTSY